MVIYICVVLRLFYEILFNDMRFLGKTTINITSLLLHVNTTYYLTPNMNYSRAITLYSIICNNETIENIT